jgi:hypothetical protein
MVAVNAADQDAENNAIDILRAHGARQIERAEGLWEDGQWVDFDPRNSPDLIVNDRAGATGAQAPGASQ